MEATIASPLAENLIGFSTNRAHVYGFLSRCFEGEVDAAFARQIGDFALEGDTTLSEALFGMQADVLDTSDEHLEQLAVIFNRVFFGMGPRACDKAFPYESVYTSRDGLLMQEAYSRAVQEYRSSCFVKNPDFPEPEDHLAVELAFMRVQCEDSVSAIESGDEESVERAYRKQLVFLQEHLLNWITPFAADMRKAAGSGFYFHLATFVETYLKNDAEALLEVLGEEG